MNKDNSPMKPAIEKVTVKAVEQTPAPMIEEPAAKTVVMHTPAPTNVVKVETKEERCERESREAAQVVESVLLKRGPLNEKGVAIEAEIERINKAIKAEAMRYLPPGPLLTGKQIELHSKKKSWMAECAAWNAELERAKAAQASVGAWFREQKKIEEWAELARLKQEWLVVVQANAPMLNRTEELSMQLLLTTTLGRGIYPADLSGL